MAKVELIIKEGKPVGWKISGETPEEIKTVNTIRNLQFFGIEETGIEYGGRTGKGYEYAGTLIWAQRQHLKGIQDFVIKSESVDEAG